MDTIQNKTCTNSHGIHLVKRRNGTEAEEEMRQLKRERVCVCDESINVEKRKKE